MTKGEDVLTGRRIDGCCWRMEMAIRHLMSMVWVDICRLTGRRRCRGSWDLSSKSCGHGVHVTTRCSGHQCCVCCLLLHQLVETDTWNNLVMSRVVNQIWPISYITANTSICGKGGIGWGFSPAGNWMKCIWWDTIWWLRITRLSITRRSWRWMMQTESRCKNKGWNKPHVTSHLLHSS